MQCANQTILKKRCVLELLSVRPPQPRNDDPTRHELQANDFEKTTYSGFACCQFLAVPDFNLHRHPARYEHPTNDVKKTTYFGLALSQPSAPIATVRSDHTTNVCLTNSPAKHEDQVGSIENAMYCGVVKSTTHPARPQDLATQQRILYYPPVYLSKVAVATQNDFNTIAYLHRHPARHEHLTNDEKKTTYFVLFPSPLLKVTVDPNTTGYVHRHPARHEIFISDAEEQRILDYVSGHPLVTIDERVFISKINEASDFTS